MKSFRDDCILIENSLALWVGGDLEAELRDRVDQHLSQCERCDVKARALEESRLALISGLQADEARGPNLWPGIQSALRSEGYFARDRELIAASAVSTPATVTNARTWSRRNTRLLARFGVAAAAAVLVGFWLGRLGSDVAHVTEPHVGVSTGKPVPSDLVVIPSSPRTGAIPVSDNTCLRRLAPGESRLSDTAENFGAEWSITPGQFGNSSVGSPASLQSVQTRR